MAKPTNNTRNAQQPPTDDPHAPSDNERRLAEALTFVLRYRILTQAVVTMAAIVSGYALASFIRNGGARRLSLDIRDGIQSRRGDREAEGRMAGRFAGDFLAALGLSRE